VYLLLSLILSTFIDWLARMLRWRAHILEDWLRRLLDDKTAEGIVSDIYGHPFIKVLFGERGGKPANIPPRSFALALLDLFAPATNAKKTRNLTELREAIKDSERGEESIKATLLMLIDEAQGKLEKAIENIQEWFDDPGGTSNMRYRWRIQIAVFITAGVVCSMLNLDTIMIANELWKRPALRESTLAVAESITSEAERTGRGAIRMEIDEVFDKLEASRIPVGWCRDCNSEDPRRVPETRSGWLVKILGLLATTLSTSLGAPFWFDLLRKILGFRKDLRRPKSEPAAVPGKTGNRTL
jgi:hypothetical protein